MLFLNFQLQDNLKIRYNQYMSSIIYILLLRFINITVCYMLKVINTWLYLTTNNYYPSIFNNGCQFFNSIIQLICGFTVSGLWWNFTILVVWIVLFRESKQKLFSNFFKQLQFSKCYLMLKHKQLQRFLSHRKFQFT